MTRTVCDRNKYLIFKSLAERKKVDLDAIALAFEKKNNIYDSRYIFYNFKKLLTKCDFLEIVNSFQTLYNPAFTNMIPQFSNFEKAVETLLCHLVNFFPRGMDFKTAGLNLLDANRKYGALLKYGENHMKLIALLGLVYHEESTNLFYINNVSEGFTKLNSLEKKEITCKLILTIPLIAKIFALSFERQVIISELISTLSPSTIKRRMSSIFNLLNKCMDYFTDRRYLLTRIRGYYES